MILYIWLQSYKKIIVSIEFFFAKV